MKRAFVSAALLTCAAFLHPQGAVPPGYPDVRGEASRAAADAASRRMEAGDLEGAGLAAEEARALDASNADALYISALSSLRRGRPTRESEGFLRAALSGGRFLRYGADDAARLLAQILIRTKRYSEARALLDRPALAADSDALYLRSRALRFLGDERGFLDAADSGLDRFPADARFPREILDYAGSSPGGVETTARVARVEARLGYYRYLDPEILVLLAPFRASEEERRDTLLEYRALGRRSPRASILASELGILDGPAAAREFFSFPSLSWNDLRSLRGRMQDEAALEAFSQAFSRFSGEISRDDNGDGIPETVTSYRLGEIGSWNLDFDQDGIPEASLGFRENVPAAGRMEAEGGEIVFEYGEYPHLSFARFSGVRGVREYLFPPGALAFPVMELSLEAGGRDGKFYAPQRTAAPIPGEAAFLAAAYRVSERPGSVEASDRVTEFDRGLPVQSRLRTGDGRSGLVIFRNGRPSYELADMDDDGLFESRFVYDGEPEPMLFETDFDLDGVFEYRESLKPPFERTWDYDQDGKADARTSVLGDGGELREFSRRFDGRLDTALVVRAGRVVRVLRGGADVPLTPDSGGRVLWVGRKPFDFGAVVPKPGPGVRGGVRYRVVRFGDQILAEAVD